MGKPTTVETLAVRQTKFSNGEISPSMYGDVAHPKWMASLRTCKNWLPIPQGALVGRPGTKFIASTRYGGVSKSRLVPFVFSDGQAYALEFSALILRVYQNGAQVANIDGAGHSEIATPYTEAMLPYLKFAQVGNTVTICYGGQAGGAGLAPRDMACTVGAVGGVPWALTATKFVIPAGAVNLAGGPAVAILPWATGAIYSRGSRAYTVDATNSIFEWVSIQDSNQNHAPPNPPTLNSAGTSIQGTLWWMPAVDDTANPASDHKWAQTAVVQDSNGITYESAPMYSLEYNTALSAERQLAIIPYLPVLAVGYTLLYYRLYRSNGGLFGWVKDFTRATLVNYPNAAVGVVMDEGGAPDYAQQPPVAGYDPFLVNGADSFPAVVGYMDQRRMFAASPAIPQAIWMSKDGDFYRWDRPTPGADTDAILITIAAEKLEQPRAFAPMRRGIVMTSQSEWTLSGPNGGAITRTGRDLKWQSGWGSGWLNPIKVGNGLIFCTAKSNMIRDLFPLYGTYVDNWDGQELSFMARHMFDLFTITAWAYQSVPYPVVWAVRSDGKLLSLTYQHAPPSFGQQLADGVVAFAVHDTGGSQQDIVEDVCVVPEPPEDAVYLIVKRLVQGQYQRYIERMNNPVCPASPFVAGVSDPRYGIYLDSAVQYDGHNTGADTTQLSGGVYTALAQAIVTCSTNKFAAADADPATRSAVVFDPEGANVICPIVHYTSATQVTVELPYDLTAVQIAAWATAATTSWGLAKSTITLANLLGYPLDTLDANGARGIGALADGNPSAVVSFVAGVLTLQTPALVICAGLSYNGDVSLLDAHHPNADIRNRFKRLVRIGFEVAGGRGLWAGQDFDKLWEWQQRKAADSYANVPLAVGYFEQEVTDSWDKGGRAVLRHIDPLPMTIASALREYELGGT